MTSNPMVYLVDVDNTLLDNDPIQADLRRHLEREFGADCRRRYWAILERRFTDLGYRDYRGALQRYRVEHPKDIHFERPGIFAAVDGHVLIHIHKDDELDDVERRYPAARYVLIDDKPQILAAVKKVWGDRVTTILPRQGQFALAAEAASYPAPDLTVERIGDLLDYDLPALFRNAATKVTGQ